MPDEILTLPEVAQLLKVAEKTVCTMGRKSELPPSGTDEKLRVDGVLVRKKGLGG